MTGQFCFYSLWNYNDRCSFIKCIQFLPLKPSKKWKKEKQGKTIRFQGISSAIKFHKHTLIVPIFFITDYFAEKFVWFSVLFFGFLFLGCMWMWVEIKIGRWTQKSQSENAPEKCNLQKFLCTCETHKCTLLLFFAVYFDGFLEGSWWEDF